MPNDGENNGEQSDCTSRAILTERYYVNKRVDALEAVMSDSFRELQAAISDLKGDIKDNKTQIHAVLLECQKTCNGEIKELRVDVNGLKGYKNRAVGAVGVMLLLLGMWKVG